MALLITRPSSSARSRFALCIGIGISPHTSHGKCGKFFLCLSYRMKVCTDAVGLVRPFVRVTLVFCSLDREGGPRREKELSGEVRLAW